MSITDLTNTSATAAQIKQERHAQLTKGAEWLLGLAQNRGALVPAVREDGSPDGSNMARRNYSGAEQHQCQRAGCNAFLDLPSRFGNHLRYRTYDSIKTCTTVTPA